MSEKDDRASRQSEIKQADFLLADETLAEIRARNARAKRDNLYAPWGGRFATDKPHEFDIILQPGKA